MKIYRRGARRYKGWKTLVDGVRPEVSFTANQNEIFLAVDRQAQSRPSRSSPEETPLEPQSGLFKYQVNLTLEDVGDVIAKLAKDGTTQAPSDLRDALKPHVGSLLKLISCAKGFTLKRIRKFRAAGDG